MRYFELFCRVLTGYLNNFTHKPFWLYFHKGLESLLFWFIGAYCLDGKGLFFLILAFSMCIPAVSSKVYRQVLSKWGLNIDMLSAGR